MIRPNQSKSIFRALVSAMALSITLATHASEADEKPKAVIALPADSSTPVIATVKVGGHSYRMLVDTGAGNLFFHLPIAKRDLVPSPMDAAAQEQVRQLSGDGEIEIFKVKKFSVGDWTVRPEQEVFAVDLTPMVQRYDVDGLLGVPYLAQLSWHWDNRSGQLRGYPHNSRTISSIRSRLQCEQFLDVEGMPGIALNVGKDRALFAIDTAELSASGNVHPVDREALALRNAVGATGSKNLPPDSSGQAQPPLHFAQIRNVSLGQTRLDGLVLAETPSSSSLGRGFFAKFDEVLLDFGSNNFCVPTSTRITGDDLSAYLAD